MLLGTYASNRPPAPLDLGTARFTKGALTPLAMFFTDLGLWFALVPIALIVFGVAAYFHRDVLTVGTWAASQMLSQGIVLLLKPAFQRVRPDAPLGYRLVDFSYPSGHAVTAIVFYAGLAIIVAHSQMPVPVRTALCTLLLICTVGIAWSRLALGAHYLTDVIGGLLFGTAWLATLLALATSIV